MAVLRTYVHRDRSLSFQLVSLDNGSVTSKTCFKYIDDAVL